jgi:hypothetical protein
MEHLRAVHRGFCPPIGLGAGAWGQSGSGQRRPLPLVPSAFMLKVRAKQLSGVVQYLPVWAVSPLTSGAGHGAYGSL